MLREYKPRKTGVYTFGSVGFSEAADQSVGNIF